MEQKPVKMMIRYEMVAKRERMSDRSMMDDRIIQDTTELGQPLGVGAGGKKEKKEI